MNSSNSSNPSNPSNPSNSSNSSNRLLLLALIILFAGIILYGPSITKLAEAVIHREGSSHGVFVPFLSAFFIWIKRDVLRKTEMRNDLIGIPVMLAGLIFPIFDIGPYSLQILGFIIFISGTVILLLGRGIFKEIAFPLVFLITFIPIPDNIYSWLAENIRIVSFGGSRWIISLMGIPFMHEGNLIYFHNATLVVGESCSGIRYLVSYFVFSMAYAYLYRERMWSRVAVVCSSIIISLFASVCRLASIFILVHFISPWWGEHKPHVFISWCVFFGVLIMSISLDQYFQNRMAIKQGG